MDNLEDFRNKDDAERLTAIAKATNLTKEVIVRRVNPKSGLGNAPTNIVGAEAEADAS